MSDSFDPYRVWLGIPPESRPPTHYELLGISPHETEAAVINAAVVRQSAYVRNFQLGKYAKDATKILNEIAAAKACLLDPVKRAKYDAELKGREAAVVQPAAQNVAAPLAVGIDLDQLAGTAATHPPAAARLRNPQRRLGVAPGKRKPTRLARQIPVAAAAALIFAVVLFILVRHRDGDEPREQAQTANSIAPDELGAAGSSAAGSTEAASEPVVKGTVLPSHMATSTDDAAAPVRVNSTATAAVSMDESTVAKLLSQAVTWYRAEGDPSDSLGTSDGTLNGSVKFATGVVGQAFQFDGSNGSVLLSGPFVFNRPGDASLALCLRFTSPANEGEFDLIWGRADGTDENRFQMYVTAGGLLGMNYRAPSGAVHSLFSGIQIGAGTFVNVAVVRTSNVYSLYVNGVEVATAMDPSPDLPTTDSWQLSGRPGYPFVGEADEIATFDRALTDAEVKSLSRFHSVQQNAVATQEAVANRHPAHDNYTSSSAGTPVSVAANKLLGQAVALYRAEGNADDSVGKHHGKLQGDASITPITVGHAFKLGGDGVVVVPDAPELNPTEQFTMMAWIRPEALAWSHVVSKSTNEDGPKRRGFHLGISPDRKFTGQFTAPGEAWAANQAWGQTESDGGQWLHVATTYDGRLLQLYKDGICVASPEVGRKALCRTDANLIIGGLTASGGLRFKGLIDDAALFDRALGQSEIETIYRGTLEGKAGANDLLSDAVAWYRAEGNADDSAGTHKGKLEGGVAFKAMKSRRAFDFDGTGSIVVANSADLSPENRFTAMAWICPRKAPQSESLIISKIGNASGNAGYELGLSPPDASLFVAFNAPGEPRRANALRWHPIASGQWVHVAARYDGDELVTFLNGGDISHWNCGSGCGGRTIVPSHANFRISGDDDGKSRFDGLVDNVAFFNRALSNAEIGTIYRGTFGELRGDDMGDFVRLRAGGGVQAPVEFAGPIDVRFTARTNKLNIRMMYGRAWVIWNWEVDPKQLPISRLDGTTLTIPVTPLESDRWYAFRYIITPRGMRILVDDAVVFDESRGNAFFPPSPVRVYTADSTIDVKDFTIKPIEWLTAEQEAALARHTSVGTIDVLALVDPARDAKSGKWTADFEGLHSPRDSVNAALRLPVAVPDEYSLTIVAERAKGWKGTAPILNVGHVGAGKQFNSTIDWDGTAGLERIDGRHAHENESTVHCGNLFEDGRTSVVTYIVRRAGVEMLFDGRQILNWKGDYRRFSLQGGWRNPIGSPLRLFLGTHCDWHFKAIRLTPLTVANAGSPAAKEPATDLLKTIDLKKHARGGWSFDGPVLVSPPNMTHAGVRFPGVVPDEYRLRIVAERPRGFQGPPQLHVGLVTRSSQATLVLDADQKSGLEAVGGKMYQENATTFQGDLFIDGIESTIDCTVDKESIRVDFDGHTIIDWHGDLKQLAPTWTQFGAPKRAFWIGTHCNYRIKKMELVPLTENH